MNSDVSIKCLTQRGRKYFLEGGVGEEEVHVLNNK